MFYKENPRNKLSQLLEENEFTQLGKEATHIEGGNLDHIYYYGGSKADEKVEIERYSPYYSDHDANCITLQMDQDGESTTR